MFILTRNFNTACALNNFAYIAHHNIRENNIDMLLIIEQECEDVLQWIALFSECVHLRSAHGTGILFI
jgi:hypothetical protein